MDKRIIHSVFEETADRFPERTAVEHQGRTVTYRQLDRDANRFGHALAALGMGKGEIAGIFMEEGILYIKSLLGTLKTGGIVMPLNTRFPRKRLEYSLTKTLPRVLITCSSLKDELIRLIAGANLFSHVKYLLVVGEEENPISLRFQNGEWLSEPREWPEQRLPLVSDPGDTNYILFTSGSTGEPKAIAGSQKGLSHFIHWEIGEFGLDEQARVSLLAPTTFDVSLRDIFVPLVAGGTLCIPDADTRTNSDRLLRWMKHSGLTLFHCVPSLFRMLMQEIEQQGRPGQVLPSLRHILLAGEPLYGRDVNLWRRLGAAHTELVNLYGPTETTLAKAFFRVREGEIPSNEMVPVGKPIPNTALLIIKEGRLTSIGEIGEVYIKTPFRSNGYYRAPDLNAQSFVQNPLNPDEEDIVYRTGDLGKYLPDRSVQLIGRLDLQVKVNGVRVELAEIEKAVLSCDGIRQALVTSHKKENLENTLICYYSESRKIGTDNLIDHLKTHLPDYMIPSFFVRLDQFPLNLNGKIDRRALPKPEGLIYEKAGYEPPATPTEVELAKMWEEVLGLKRIGVNHSFMEVGGNSLNAIRILSRIGKTFHAEINIREFFDHPTIRRLSQRIDQSKRRTYREIEPVAEASCYALSHAQKRLFLLDLIEEGFTAYNNLEALRIDGDFDVSAFRKSFEILIGRHESLRTTFLVLEGEPMQQIRKAIDFQMEEIDFRNIGEVEARISEKVREEAATPFDFKTGPLLRAKLLRTGEKEYYLLFNMHHIVVDGWSMGVMVRELMDLYNARVTGREISLSPLRVQYKDFAAWQNSLLESDQAGTDKHYWLEKLAGEIPRLNLPVDFGRPSFPTFNGRTVRFHFEPELTDRLKALARQKGASLFMTLLALVKVLLYRYTSQKDIIVGSPVTGRNHPDLENQVGFYVNLLALRDRIEGHEDFLTLLERVKATTIGAYDHQGYPFDLLVGELDIERSTDRAPLFEVMIYLQEKEPVALNFEKITVTELEIDTGKSRYDLTFGFIEFREGLRLDINYSTDLFREERIERLTSHLFELVRSVVESPSLPISQLNILTESEKRRLLLDFNRTETEYPLDMSIVDLFESQVERTPENTALLFGQERLTYRQLNEHANQLAHFLKDRWGLRTEEVVGVRVDRSVWQVIGFLGILKAGGVYLPIDPTYPETRIDLLLRDGECRIVLTDLIKGEAKEAGIESPEIPEVIEISRAKLGKGSNPERSVSGHHLAYVIYTSGSTGTPKGVMVEHHSLVNMALDQIRFLGITSEDRVMQVASPSFDVSLFEMTVALLSGATLVMADRDTLSNPAAFVRYLETKRATVLALTPQHLNSLNGAKLKTVRVLITGGEPPILSDVLLYGKGTQYINTYGPTEATVNVACHRVDLGVDSGPGSTAFRGGDIPIGRPISSTSVYVLDDSFNLLPIGVDGEICVSGAGLARGYRNQPELTKVKFVKNPFRPGERLYRTGDLGRWLPGGLLQFVGRKDNQVKVRGFRIEPGEIEHHLLEHPAIKEAVVLPRSFSGTQELVAYVTGKEDLDVAELRGYLKRRLPDYMVPAFFFPLATLPMTPNGKVDRKALPDPGEGRPEDASAYVAPRSALEARLTSIWQDVLKVDRIGIHDNFFELGGHSLKATRISSRIHEDLGREVSLREIFTSPTIAGLASVTAQKVPSSLIQIEKLPDQHDYPVSHAQRRLWAIDQMQKGLIAYNISGAYLIEGNLDPKALSKAFEALVERHESLRTLFLFLNGEPRQKISREGKFTLKEIDISSEQDPEALSKKEVGKAFATPFDLEKGPLMRAELMRMGADRNTLFFNMHHIVGDGWSMAVLEKELVTLYNAYAAGEEKILAPLKIQYRDFAAWQNGLLHSEMAEEDRRYWHHKLSGEITVLNLPTDFARPSVQTFYGKTRRFSFDGALTSGLIGLGKKSGTSLFMVLVTCLKALLYRYTEQEDIIVGSPVAGRAHPDLEDQVGFYINSLVLRDEVKAEEPFLSLLEKVRSTVIEAHEHQLYPFDSLVNELNLDRDMSRNPFFDVMVAVQDQEGALPQLAGVKVRELEIDRPTSKFDLTFNFLKRGPEFQLEMEYNTDLFRDETIGRIAGHFSELVRSVLRDEKQRIIDLNLLTEEEREQLLVTFNDTRRDFPREKNIVDLFEDQAARHPERLALLSGDASLTYRELNERSNEIAHFLRDRFRIEPDEIVGLLSGRSSEMIAGILGILKAGGAYLPIDLDYPPERIGYVLRDSRCRVLLTDGAYGEGFRGEAKGPVSGPGLSVVGLFQARGSIRTNPPRAPSADSLAYVMYTSGSTGEPKGVMVEHRSVVRLVRDTNYTSIQPGDRVLQLSNYAFDGSTFDIFGALLNGASLYVVSKDLLLSLDRLCRFIEENGINITFITTALLNKLIDLHPEVVKEFDKIYFGGQDASLRHVRMALKYRKKNDSIVHVYGPTETTTFATSYVIDSLGERERSIPIGAPIGNTTLFILDGALHLQPIGVWGEIFIGGDGVARGYLNNPGLTSERFIESPFEEGERLYRTGDIGRWLSDGNIEFSGRKDGQVKVRGYRVELGEIENHLLRHPAVREAAVLAREAADGNKELVAYLVRREKSGAQLNVSELREFLKDFLPDYMFPAYFVELDSLPLSPNGKVDRKALPSPREREMGLGMVFVRPRNPVEERLAEVWEEVLERKGIGIHDNYFALGGDSIKAIQALSRLREAGLRLEMRHLFQHPTIAELSPMMEIARGLADRGPVTGVVPLTPIQAWFFEQCRTDRHHFNQDVLLRSSERLDKDALATLFRKIQEHHDGLRMRYRIEDGKVLQENGGLDCPHGFEAVDLREEKWGLPKLDRHAEAVQRSLCLDKGPLIKAVLYRLEEGDRLLIVAHHLIVDGVSWRILLEDIATGYEQIRVGKEIHFPSKTDSFKNWAERMVKYSMSEPLLLEKDYWREIESTRVEPLPFDFALSGDTGGRFGDKGSREFCLTKTDTESLLTRANQAYRTEANDLLLTALARTMKRWHGGSRTLLTLEGHGREEVLEGMDISRTVGWFTSLYPVIIDLPEGKDAGCQINKIKETLRKVPNRGVGYGVLKYLTPLELKREMDFGLKPRMAFNYLGQFDSESKTGLFRVTEEPAGLSISSEAEAAHDLDMSAIVTDGQLRVTLHYDRTRYREETAKNILVGYKEEIEGIIAHCLGQESSEGVISNVDYDGLLGEDLDRILVNLPDQ